MLQTFFVLRSKRSPAPAHLELEEDEISGNGVRLSLMAIWVWGIVKTEHGGYEKPAILFFWPPMPLIVRRRGEDRWAIQNPKKQQISGLLDGASASAGIGQRHCWPR